MLLATFILGGYVVLVFVLTVGWERAIRHRHHGEIASEARISVIIPVRDEARNVSRLISCLTQQQYSNFEVIFVDDHSSDETVHLIKAAGVHNVHVHHSSSNGKKAAITEGVRLATGTIIATTDGDCVSAPGWLRAINASFTDADTVFVFGPVRFLPGNSVVSSMQSIEFASLIGSGAATATLGFPTMCNGANLAYRKTVFEEVGGYTGNLQVASGDDEFLMRKVHERYPGGIAFAASADAIVDTEPPGDFSTFFNQRIRWASKWRHQTSLATGVLALFIVMSQAATIFCLFQLLTAVSLWALLVLLAKAVAEYYFLRKVCKFLRLKWNPLAFTALQVLYPVYVIVIGVISNFMPYRWKGRQGR